MTTQHETSTVQSDRLQKAIERNRQKRLKKDPVVLPTTITPIKSRPILPINTPNIIQNSHVIRTLPTTPLQKTATTPIVSPFINTQKRVHSENKFFNFLKKILFLEPILDYLENIYEKTRRWLAWGIVLFLFFKLLFSSNGVIDFYQMNELLTNIENNIEKIKFDNEQLKNEINEIRYNPIYQKRLAREQLGVISEKEFLILFE